MPVITVHQPTEDMEVHFDYQPREPQTWNHPGCDSSVRINEILVKGVDVLELMESSGDIRDIEIAVLEKYEESLAE